MFPYILLAKSIVAELWSPSYPTQGACFWILFEHMKTWKRCCCACNLVFNYLNYAAQQWEKPFYPFLPFLHLSDFHHLAPFRPPLLYMIFGPAKREKERDVGKCCRFLGNISDTGNEVRKKAEKERQRGEGKSKNSDREGNEKAKGDGGVREWWNTNIFFNQYCGNVAPW